MWYHSSVGVYYSTLVTPKTRLGRGAPQYFLFREMIEADSSSLLPSNSGRLSVRLISVGAALATVSCGMIRNQFRWSYEHKGRSLGRRRRTTHHRRYDTVTVYRSAHFPFADYLLAGKRYGHIPALLSMIWLLQRPACVNREPRSAPDPCGRVWSRHGTASFATDV